MRVRDRDREREIIRSLSRDFFSQFDFWDKIYNWFVQTLLEVCVAEREREREIAKLILTRLWVTNYNWFVQTPLCV